MPATTRSHTLQTPRCVQVQTPNHSYSFNDNHIHTRSLSQNKDAVLAARALIELKYGSHNHGSHNHGSHNHGSHNHGSHKPTHGHYTRSNC
jgi:hypothetical protein